MLLLLSLAHWNQVVMTVVCWYGTLKNRWLAYRNLSRWKTSITAIFSVCDSTMTIRRCFLAATIMLSLCMTQKRKWNICKLKLLYGVPIVNFLDFRRTAPSHLMCSCMKKQSSGYQLMPRTIVFSPRHAMMAACSYSICALAAVLWPFRRVVPHFMLSSFIRWTETILSRPTTRTVPSYGICATIKGIHFGGTYLQLCQLVDGLLIVFSPCIRYGKTPQSCMSVRFNALGTQVLALRRRLPPILYSASSETTISQFYHPDYYNSCTIKGCSFAGENDEYILSGSDDFNLYMWRATDADRE